jgi:sensor domain CHASE-containing protein
MSLRNKILSILLIAGMGYSLVDLAVQKWIILPSFEEVENNRAQINMDRCILALKNEVDHLNRFCYDWSAWDDSALYVQGKKEDFIKQTISDEVFLTQHLNAMIFLDAKATMSGADRQTRRRGNHSSGNQRIIPGKFMP